MKYIIVIPARIESQRLPRKPLIKIKGKPMLIRTYEQCVKAVSPNKIYVCTDSDEIVGLCNEHNIQVLKTSQNCLTGTDRVAEFSETIKADLYINVQGDEPVINPMDIKKILSEAKKGKYEVYNGYTPIKHELDFFSKSTPKVVFNTKNELMYMSRAPIPHSKLGDFNESYRQVCIYSFTKNALDNFKRKNSKERFENFEDIEILRFLEIGTKVKMVELSDLSMSVDDPEDIEKIINYLENNQLD